LFTNKEIFPSKQKTDDQWSPLRKITIQQIMVGTSPALHKFSNRTY